MRTLKSLLASTLFLAAAACGDDSSGGDDSPDIDADTTVPDGEDIDGTPAATRSGTIAVSDIEVTTPQGANAGLRGAVVSIEFVDLTMDGGEAIYGTSSVGACLVTRYDVGGTATPHPAVDAATVTVSAPETGDSGLLMPVAPCNFVDGRGYLCIAHAAVANDVVVAPGLNGTASYVLGDQDLSSVDAVGSYLAISGLTQAGNNGSFPVVGQGVNQDSNTLVVGNPLVATEAAGTDNVQYSVINAAGPIPTAGQGPTFGDFLSDETTSVRIQKPADDDWGAFDVTLYARGEGLTLNSESAQPHEFPFTAQNVTFSCDPDPEMGTGGNCGADIETPPAGTIKAFIVSGRTTDGSTATIPDYIMPPPVTEYATFQCGFPLGMSATIPEAAVEAILSTNPTRIETRVLVVAGAQVMDGENVANVVVGHGLVGHSTRPPQ